MPSVVVLIGRNAREDSQEKGEGKDVRASLVPSALDLAKASTAREKGDLRRQKKR